MATPDGWEATTYGAVFTETHERRGSQLDLPVLSVTKTRGPMLASERFGKPLHGRDLAKYRVARRGTFVADPMLLWDGTIGRQEAAESGLVSPDYRVYELVEHVASDFMRYVVRDPRMLRHYQGGARGTNVRRNRIAREDFLRIPFQLPPLPEQRKIAAILSSVDEVIEKTEAVIEQLQVVKMAMMQELLTRGLPGRHTRFKQTEIGEVPEEWEVGPLGSFCEVASGGTPSRERGDFWNGTIPWVKTGEVNYSVITDTEEKITKAGLAESSARLFPKGTVVMAMYGQGATRGRVGVLGIDAATNQACLGFFPKAGLVAGYLYQLLTWSYERLRGMGHEGTQKNLNAGLVRSLVVPLPPEDEQRPIADAAADIDTRIAAERSGLDATRNVRNALMTVLLTGELRVTPDEDAA